MTFVWPCCCSSWKQQESELRKQRVFQKAKVSLCFSALYIKITNFVIWYTSFELSLDPTSVERTWLEHWRLLNEDRGTIIVFQKVKEVREERTNHVYASMLTYSWWAATKVLHQFFFSSLLFLGQVANSLG